MKAKSAVTLTDTERLHLSSLESSVDEVLAVIPAMIEGGKALAEIRDKQLYRDQAKTWQLYVEQRFRMTTRRADQLIVFAGLTAVIEHVSQEMRTAVPILSERALRPLAGLPDQDAVDTIREAASADGGLTPRTLKAAASKRKCSKRKGIPRPVSLKVPGGTVLVSINSKGVKLGATMEALVEAALGQLRSMRAEAA